MNHRIRLAAATLATVAASGLIATSGASSAPKTQTSLKGVTLKVGGQTDGLRALLVRSGALNGKAYAIKSSTFSSGPPLLEALQAGKIDIGVVGNTPPLFAAQNGKNFRIVAALKQRSAVGDRLLVPKDSAIGAAADLKGKRIAYTRGSSAHGFLIQALKRAGLTTKDVQLKDLPPADSLAAFNSGSVDAWATFEPFITIAGSNAKVLNTGTGYAAAGYNYVVARTSALADVKKRTAIRDYLVRLKRGVAYGAKNQQQWAEAFNQESNLPTALALAAIKKTLLDVVPAKGKAITDLQTLSNVLSGENVIKELTVKGLFSNQLAG